MTGDKDDAIILCGVILIFIGNQYNSLLRFGHFPATNRKEAGEEEKLSIHVYCNNTPVRNSTVRNNAPPE